MRPQWNNSAIIRRHAYAKASYIKNKDIWKVYWMRSDGKWHAYSPHPVVGQLSIFLKLVEEDKHHCFKG
ncbi:MAG: DUF3024 domain-containing protein [Lewinellaceae bacterium]|nr:DUF3024 domain-containing protein [Lewinellaceae bacterium]